MPHRLLFNNHYHQQLPGFYTELTPTPLQGARLLYHNATLAQELGLSEDWFDGDNSRIWAGEQLLPGMAPLAQVYSGHQFGVWAGSWVTGAVSCSDNSNWRMDVHKTGISKARA